MRRLTLDGTAEPVSRDQILRRERGQGIFPVQLTTSMMGKYTRLIHTLLKVLTVYTYVQGRGRSGNGNGGGGERRSARWERGRERGRGENRDGSGDGNESSSGDGNGDEDGNGDGNEDGIGEGGREAKKRKKPHRSCRCHVENGEDLGGKRKKT